MSTIGPLNIPLVERTHHLPEGAVTLICFSERRMPDGQVQMSISVLADPESKEDVVELARRTVSDLCDKLKRVIDRINEEARLKKSEGN